MINSTYIFIAFCVFVSVLLYIDLNHNKGREVKMKTALMMTLIWVSFSISLTFLLYFFGHYIHNIHDIESLKLIVDKYQHPILIDSFTFESAVQKYNTNLALEYLTGYIVEYSLSIDNVFVIILILHSFNVPRANYHRLLFWGIFGAIVMRFILIFLGVELVEKFEWTFYILGAFLIFTGAKLFIDRNKEEKIDMKNHKLVRFFSKIFPVDSEFKGCSFFYKNKGKIIFTPMVLALLVIEFTDLIFALDSIPAIISITKDPNIIFYSNIAAILGLRSLFFLLENIIHKFHYLKIGLSIILVFVGLKMLIHSYLQQIGFTTFHSLLVIVLVMGLSILCSILFPKPNAKPI